MRYEVRRGDDLGTAIAEFRVLRGITQADLAQRAGIHRTYLSNLEQGEVPMYVERFMALAEALGLTITITDGET